MPLPTNPSSTMRPRRRGLSLVELLIVLAIILIVVGMIVAVLSKVYRIIDSWR